MRLKIAIIFNEPESDRYSAIGEFRAVAGVLEEVRPVHKALSELGYTVTKVPLHPPLELVKDRLKTINADLVFNLFEGFEGQPETEAVVASMLCELGIPFTGNLPSTLALALDKAKAKAILESDGLRTPRYQSLNPTNLNLFHLKFPCIVKPLGEDASHGLTEESVVNNVNQLEKEVINVSSVYGGNSLVEEFLEGREFNVTLLGNKEPMILPVAEMVYYLPPELPRLLTFAAKWVEESVYYKGTRATCPAEVGEEERQRISQTALTAFKLLDCCGYARVDMRMDTEEVPNVLEVNPNPDISPGYGAARQAAAAGLSYNQFIEKILMYALEEQLFSRVKQTA